MPIITVVIPTYNGAAHLSATIESVLAQTIPDIELVIVDDGSSDSTRDIAHAVELADHRVRLIEQENSGVARARNRGFAEAHPDSGYIMFLDHDDVLEPDALQRLQEALILRSDAAGAHGKARIISFDGQVVANGYEHQPTLERRRIGRSVEKGGRLTGIAVPDDEDTIFDILLYGNCIATPGQALFRRDVLPGEPFDPNVEPADDWDLYVRLAQTHLLAYVPSVVLGWRQHERNRSNDSAVVRKAHANLHRKWPATTVSPAQRRQILRQYAYTASATTIAAIRAGNGPRFAAEALPAISALLSALRQFKLRASGLNGSNQNEPPTKPAGDRT